MDPRPEPFSAYTTPEFWDDPHISEQMLACHLDPRSAPASRPHDVIDRSVEWIADVAGLRQGSTVLDLGCGPGLYAMRLARRGVATHGIDVSHRSIEHARAAVAAERLPATFEVGNYLEASLGGPYDAALLIYEDFSALSPLQRNALLRRAQDALRPGGALVLDVTAAPRFDGERPGRVEAHDLDAGFWARPPYEGVHETFTYPDLRLVLNRYTIVTGGSRRQFWNWMHCLTTAEVAEELTRARFGTPAVFGDVAGAPYDPDGVSFAVVARTPGLGPSDRASPPRSSTSG